MNNWWTPGRALSSILGHFGRQSKAALLTKAYLTTVAIAIIDFMTGRELSLLIFYFFPVVVVSWFAGKRQGITIALFAAVATALHDLLLADSSLVVAVRDLSHSWRLLQTGGVFLMVSFIIAALRASESEKRNIEHRLAQTVQSFLVPQTARSSGALTCFGRCESSDHLAGDFFDLIPLGPMKLAIVVGDVCGKGISAALLMAYIQGLLQSQVPFVEATLGELMNNVNRSLHRVTADDRFATLFIGVYDEKNCLLTYVNAGHDPPVVFRFPPAIAGDGQREIPHDTHPLHGVTGTITPIDAVKLETGGLLLGVDPNFGYQTMSHNLQDGDILVCDTDGMKDTMDKQGRMYGADRLIHVVASHYSEPAERIIDAIFQDVETFAGQKTRADDITLVVGKVSVCRPCSDI